ncbi:molybdenum cofactor sulfurase [Diaporthe amygdali]|uniref:molybdenum cofactor sulfurase n=1 Tax=Phomopsis amygdali TaxID=1214568 RepID=UPI0022FECC02|nr:molybdenum cofactor sulfurase [Diaporthe amygdali]KAJ0121288.1 molybdenum cofactor sulfurase [Diaporthe amygdali]
MPPRRLFNSTPSPKADRSLSNIADEGFYPAPVQRIRETEYPHMKKGVYLDHSGTTIYARTLIESFANHMISNLYGNPHSANAPAELSGHVVDSVRQKVLKFFGADPRHFDLVFTANATAGIKLVADCFRDLAEQTRNGSFWYGYHKDSHTSLVGMRELAYGHFHCFGSDGEVEDWLHRPDSVLSGKNTRLRHLSRRGGLGLLAYPGQSNMTGRRLPLSWPGRVRSSPDLTNTYSLLDCAALAMTSPLNAVFKNVETAPDFTCVSLYKIFGFPDLGALIVRKDSGHILTLRKYFGGGTVTMVSVLGGSWHKTKGLDSTAAESQESTTANKGPSYEIHDSLEDGTLPFHSILALGQAIDVHSRIYGSMENISRYTTYLSKILYNELRCLRHANGRPACHIYTDDDGQGYGDPNRQGATIAFNMMDADGVYIPYSDVEKIANDNGVYVRSGGICCPGGLYTALDYEPWELQRAFSAHHVCGPDGISLIHQLPTGVVRASLGAMSTRDDISKFVSFLQKTFVSQGSTRALLSEHDRRLESAPEYVEDMDYDIGSPALATAGTGA